MVAPPFFDCVASIVKILTTVGASTVTRSLAGSLAWFVSVSAYETVCGLMICVVSMVLVPTTEMIGVVTYELPPLLMVTLLTMLVQTLLTSQLCASTAVPVALLPDPAVVIVTVGALV